MLAMHKCTAVSDCLFFLPPSLSLPPFIPNPPSLTSHTPLSNPCHQPETDNLGEPGGAGCKVDAGLFLVCPDSSNKEDHKVIAVNSTNQEACMEMWVGSQLLEFGSLFRGHRVEVPRPGTCIVLMMTDRIVIC